MKAAVVFGGISPERNVSIAGGKAVCKALRERNYEVIAIDPALGKNCKVNDEEYEIIDRFPTDEELAKFSSRSLIKCADSPVWDDIDIAFLVLHGQYGEDGLFQSLLELRGVPYTGSRVMASSVGIDKLASKMLFVADRIPTPPWATVRKEEYGNFTFYGNIIRELGNKLVVKPNDQGSTIGITIIDDAHEEKIHKAISFAKKYSDIVLVEKFIEGRELTVGMIGEDPLPVIEIVPESGFYDYEHKYIKGKTKYICPAEIDEHSRKKLMDIAALAFRAIGCSGFGRVDFRMDDFGEVFCLEANTIPGFTATSLVPMAAKETGIDFPDLCLKIIDIALKEFNGIDL